MTLNCTPRIAILTGVMAIIAAVVVSRARAEVGEWARDGMKASEPAAAMPDSKDGVAPAALPVLRVVVTLPPLKSLIQPLLPDGSTLDVLIPPGVSEHGYEMTPSKLGVLGEADLVVCIGMGMEPQVDRALVQRPREARRVVTFADVVGVHGDHEEHEGEDLDHHHDHGDLATDPHLWLSPVMVQQLIDAAAKDVVALLVARGATKDQANAFVAAKADALRAKVQAVDERYRARLALAKQRTIITAHGAFGHLAARYDLKVIGLTGLHAGEPTIKALREASRVVREQGLTTIFVEPQLSPAAARRLAEESGAKVAVLDPLGGGDWFALMEKNLAALCDALGVPPEPRPASANGGAGTP